MMGNYRQLRMPLRLPDWKCIRIINELTAAALAYGLLERSQNNDMKLKTIMVYDFGGGSIRCFVIKYS